MNGSMVTPHTTRRATGLSGLVAIFGAFALDQATKLWALTALGRDVYAVLPIFNLRLSFNQGISFSLFAETFTDRPLMLAGIDPAERARRVARALEDVGLANRADHRPDQLSGGQRQRVAIARATIMQPALILADEPTGNLDRATGEEVVRLLETLNAGGVTLLMVTHDAALGARARRRVVLQDGRKIRDEPV